MKKLLILCLACFITNSAVEAKDYVKHQINEMKKSQQYSASNKYFAEYAPEVSKKSDVKIKDPKLIKLSGYEVISNDKYKAKLAKDDVEYKKIKTFLNSNKLNEYHMQAYGDDFYKVYRITERLIRANNLDFVNWRLIISAEESFNAYNSNTNLVCIHTGALDTLKDNEDALALLIGHELSHGLLNHANRKAKYVAKMNRAIRVGSYTSYLIAKKRYMKVSRDMEYAADIEGAKLALKAGYDLSKAKETISFMNTLQYADELNSTHPDPAKRLESYEENRKYFMDEEWVKQGRYNIYNSDVLTCSKSSHRNSIIIDRGKSKAQGEYYRPETLEDLYLRFGYKYYVNGEFEKSIAYFKKYLGLNKGNYAVYLYISYAYEALYNVKGKEADLEAAKQFVEFASRISPDNKYVKEQLSAL